MRWHAVGKVGTVGVGGTHGGRRHTQEIEGEKEKGWGAQEVDVAWGGVGEVGSSMFIDVHRYKKSYTCIEHCPISEGNFWSL